MFSTSFNIYFAFCYAYFICVCFMTAIRLSGTRSGFFWWSQGGNPASTFQLFRSAAQTLPRCDYIRRTCFLVGLCDGLLISRDLYLMLLCFMLLFNSLCRLNKNLHLEWCSLMWSVPWQSVKSHIAWKFVTSVLLCVTFRLQPDTLNS